MRVAPGNGGTAAVAESVDLDITDADAVARHAARERYGLVVIGPEAPLASGVADELASTRIPTFGPTRAAARLESSKAFAKEQMRRAGVPTPSARQLHRSGCRPRARPSIRRAPPVVKADWLAAGKGVVVPESREEAEAAVRDLFASVAPGARLVLEERLTGPEVSAFALVSDEARRPARGGVRLQAAPRRRRGTEHRRAWAPTRRFHGSERRPWSGWRPRCSSRSRGAWRATGSRTAASCTPASSSPPTGRWCSSSTPASAIPRPRCSCRCSTVTWPARCSDARPPTEA